MYHCSIKLNQKASSLLELRLRMLRPGELAARSWCCVCIWSVTMLRYVVNHFSRCFSKGIFQRKVTFNQQAFSKANYFLNCSRLYQTSWVFQKTREFFQQVVFSLNCCFSRSAACLLPILQILDLPASTILGRKAIKNLGSILKSRDITLPTRVCIVEAMVFPVVRHRCESWTVKKAECWRIDAFEVWYWRRLLRVPWTARRTNQCILKEINFEYSLEERMLKLKLQYFGHLMRSANSLEKTLILRKIEGKRRSGQQRMRCLDSS